ncbi:hypothetical protein M407DRAFT_213466 [Tulasnella calospora MUT 4182]|uniref:Uncharacterized protein n=1 Tax=Tulasnella calospora MUT 4182 TaxID=1051891 RepID=A0A0C3QFI8_9AGAM|nr:hypothetical protein M407DRAFT_213466 [Tulasnella calospora MUT 4182]
MSDTKIEDLDAVEDGRKSPDTHLSTEEDDDHQRGHQPAIKEWFSRDSYSGALLFNVATFILPAIYSTLSKLWIAQLDSTAVATTDTYTYINTFAEVLNEGLPRAAYLVIGDRTRLTADRINLCFTLIAFQMVLGLIMSLGFLGGAERFADGFVPADVRENSITYIRISAFAAFTSATTYSASFATRSIDRPDVPLIINTTTTALNLIFDFMFLSTFRIHTKHRPTLNTQAGIRLACDAAGAIAGLLYFSSSARRILHANNEGQLRKSIIPKYAAWLSLAKPGLFTFLESAFRNGLYLWLIHGVVALDPRSMKGIARPALRSAVIALLVEAPLCLVFSFALVKPFAKYLSNSDVVAAITARMWRTIDWCYIFYAVNTQLASILLATTTAWYFGNSLVVNLLWVFPWAVALQVGIPITENTAWPYHATIFGGSLVLSFIVTLIILTIWTRRLRAGKMKI